MDCLDKFYTQADTACLCVQRLLAIVPENARFLEPSAGNGVFVDTLRLARRDVDIVAIDIAPDPLRPDIVADDFLTWDGADECEKNWVVFGNPPFGRQASLAKKFIRKAMEFANVVAFILPRSFVKESMTRFIGLDWTLVDQLSLDGTGSVFLLPDGTTKAVPCIFQIWRKQERIVEKATSLNIRDNPLIRFVKGVEDCDYAFRRVGVYAGNVIPKALASDLSPTSHTYFAVLDPRLTDLEHRIGPDDFPDNTVGARSISKPEFLARLQRLLL